MVCRECKESPLLELKDVWLDGYGALSHHTTHELSEAEGNATIADMVNERNQWKWELFAHLLPVQIVLVLASHSPPSTELEEDASYWRHSSSGQFTTKSVYLFQVRDATSRSPMEPIWRLIWRWKGPERIRNFLWLVAHNKLLTNDQRVARHLTDNAC